MNKHVEAHISRNKNRLKSYGKVVYLNNNDNFEIELFNGHTKKVMAQIWINDELISNSGLVLQPGQRYFLERFIDTNKKLQFNTYEVEKSNKSLNAIVDNGNVKIKFYEDAEFTSYDYQKCTYTNNNIINQELWYQLNTDHTNPIIFTNQTSSLNNINNYLNTANSIETGRIEGGDTSDQSFISTNGTYNQYPFKTVELKILPSSHKPVDVSEIRNYCSNCGTRIRKQTWKFCPNCGESLD